MPGAGDEGKATGNVEVRKYLLDKAVAPLMERFMADLIQHRPDDVLGFLKQWAIEQHALAVGLADTAREEAKEKDEAAAPISNTAPPAAAEAALEAEESCASPVDLRDPLEVVSQSWKEHVASAGLQKAVVEAFFTTLFAQKPFLRKTMFEGVELSDAVEKLTPVLDAVFIGALHDAQLIEFCKEVAVGRGVQEKHLDSFLTIMASSVASKMPSSVWPSISILWNKYLSELKLRVQDAVVEAEDIVAVESSHHVGATADVEENGGAAPLEPHSDDDEAAKEAAASETRTPGELVTDSWVKLPASSQELAVKDAIDLLFLQHNILKKGPLEDLSVEDLVTLIKPIVDGVASQTITIETAKNTAFAQQADNRGLKPKHLDYLVTALLASFSKHFGARWPILNGPWTAALTAAATTFTAAAFNA